MARKFKNEVQQRNYDKIAHARRLSAYAGRANDNARKNLHDTGIYNKESSCKLIYHTC